MKKTISSLLVVFNFNLPLFGGRLVVNRVSAQDLSIIATDKGKKEERKANSHDSRSEEHVNNEFHAPTLIQFNGDLIFPPQKPSVEEKKGGLFNTISRAVDLAYKIVTVIPAVEGFFIRRFPEKKANNIGKNLQLFQEEKKVKKKKVKLIPIDQPERFRNISQPDVSELGWQELEKYSGSELFFAYDVNGIQNLQIRIAKTNTSEPDLLTSSRFEEDITPKNPYFMPNLIRNGIDWEADKGVIFEIKKLSNNSGPKLPIAVTKTGGAFIGSYSKNHVEENRPLKNLLLDYVTEDQINAALNNRFDKEATDRCLSKLTEITRNAMRPENIEKLWNAEKMKDPELQEIVLAVLVKNDPKVYNRSIYRRGANYIQIEGKGLFHVVSDTEYFNTDLLNIESNIRLVIKKDIWGRPQVFIECTAYKEAFESLPNSHVSLTDRARAIYLGRERWDNSKKVLKKYEGTLKKDRRNRNWDDPLNVGKIGGVVKKFLDEESIG